MADMNEELRRLKLEQIRMKREAASRARRLAEQIWSSEDRDRALVFAEELDAQADELELGLEPSETPEIPAPKVVQTQVQVQQGPPARDEPAKDEDEKKP